MHELLASAVEVMGVVASKMTYKQPPTVERPSPTRGATGAERARRERAKGAVPLALAVAQAAGSGRARLAGSGVS